MNSERCKLSIYVKQVYLNLKALKKSEIRLKKKDC